MDPQFSQRLSPTHHHHYHPRKNHPHLPGLVQEPHVSTCVRIALLSTLVRMITRRAQSLNRAQIFAARLTVAHQAPPVYEIFQARILK